MLHAAERLPPAHAGGDAAPIRAELTSTTIPGAGAAVVRARRMHCLLTLWCVEERKVLRTRIVFVILQSGDEITRHTVVNFSGLWPPGR